MVTGKQSVSIWPGPVCIGKTGLRCPIVIHRRYVFRHGRLCQNSKMDTHALKSRPHLTSTGLEGSNWPDKPTHDKLVHPHKLPVLGRAPLLLGNLSSSIYVPRACVIFSLCLSPVFLCSDFGHRLLTMDRAMRAGVDDVGIGVLFGLADYRYEVPRRPDCGWRLGLLLDLGIHCSSRCPALSRVLPIFDRSWS